MRTTVDVPDDLYRRLKARAALSGLKVRELMTRYLEEGLRSLPAGEHPIRHSVLPVAIPPTGTPIAALTRAELARIDEDEERQPDARPA